MEYDFIQYIVFKNIVRRNKIFMAFKKMSDGFSESLLSLGRSQLRKCHDSKFTDWNVLKPSQLNFSNHALNYLEGKKRRFKYIWNALKNNNYFLKMWLRIIILLEAEGLQLCFTSFADLVDMLD